MPSRFLRLALLSVLIPACWSGFSEIRVAGSDASAPGDRPALDRPTEDAPRPPDGAQDATADAVSFDTPSVDAADAGGLDDRSAPDVADVEEVRDAGVGLDAVDAPEPRDVAAPEDRAEGGAGDVVDVPAPCGGACGVGEECVAGRCGRWEFRAGITVDTSPFATSTSVDVVLGRLDSACAVAFGGSRLCNRADVGAPSIRSECRMGFGALVVGGRELAISRPSDVAVGCAICAADGGIYDQRCSSAASELRALCCILSPRL